MTSYDVSAIGDWLIDGARSAIRAEEVLAELCNRLAGLGIPLWRVVVFVRTLHPQIMGRRFLWRERGDVVVGEAPYDLLDSDEFRGSPIREVTATGRALRRRLADPDCPMDFAVLKQLRDEGATDYLVSPLTLTDGAVHVVTWSTRQPGGFTAPQIAAIESVVTPFARVAEIRALQRTTVNLLDTYVGKHAAQRILSGRVRRGVTEAMDAVIWLSDMRASTTLAELLPPDAFLDLLNSYFDCQVPAVLDHGGEVLKFIGDGLLAIFPVAGDDSDIDKVCGRALSAARLARTNVGRLIAPGGLADAGLRFGLALHLGQVLYGNIGSGNRLDFTCIGPAVNLAARLEKLASELGHAVVASEEFARHCPAALAPIGTFHLAGFSAERMVYGLID